VEVLLYSKELKARARLATAFHLNRLWSTLSSPYTLISLKPVGALKKAECITTEALLDPCRGTILGTRCDSFTDLRPVTSGLYSRRNCISGV